MKAGQSGERRILVVQGQYQVTDDPSIVLTTILGSCVAACLRDPIARVGGMNHFLLPGGSETSRSGKVQQYGVHLMELLVNNLMQQGAQRERLEAKLFGGGRMMQSLSDIGRLNANFAEQFLRHEGIKLVGGSLGGVRGRRLQFWPVSGRARQMAIVGDEGNFNSAPVNVPEPASGGDVELF
jgi:chemotaxis protein CheD